MKHVYHEISLLLEEESILFNAFKVRPIASQCVLIDHVLWRVPYALMLLIASIS
jgi:hypothetical protein